MPTILIDPSSCEGGGKTGRSQRRRPAAGVAPIALHHVRPGLLLNPSAIDA